MVHQMRHYDYEHRGLFFGWIGLAPVIFITDADHARVVLGTGEDVRGSP